jgi:hypothetical protein
MGGHRPRYPIMLRWPRDVIMKEKVNRLIVTYINSRCIKTLQVSGRNLPLFSLIASTFLLSSWNLFNKAICSALRLSLIWKR